MPPQRLGVLVNNSGRDQVVLFSNQLFQLGKGISFIGRLIEYFTVAFQYLITANHQRTWVHLANFQGLCFGQGVRNILRPRARFNHRRYDRMFINIGNCNIERNPSAIQELLSNFRSRRKDDGFLHDDISVDKLRCNLGGKMWISVIVEWSSCFTKVCQVFLIFYPHRIV